MVIQFYSTYIKIIFFLLYKNHILYDPSSNICTVFICFSDDALKLYVVILGTY